jgi:predicted murein hydrolase (TIGR00659 family)
MINFVNLMHAEGAIFWLPCTILVFSASSALYRWLNKAPFANPTLVTIAAMAVILLGTGVPYRYYFESTAVIHYMLGTAVVALAVPLYRNIGRLQGRCFRITAALFAGSLASIVVGLSVALLAHASLPTVLSLAPKSATAAVSMEISRLIGGTPGVTAALTIFTGIIGAVAGPYILDFARIRAPEARGFAMGVAGHGIATARAFTEGEIAGSFAGLGLVLNAILTALIVPSLVHLMGLEFRDKGINPAEIILQARHVPYMLSSTSSHLDLIVPRSAAQHRVPVIYPYRFFAQDGGQLAYGINRVEQFRGAAVYVNSILRDERPNDLPVQSRTQF